jgi:hypothetical protein
MSAAQRSVIVALVLLVLVAVTLLGYLLGADDAEAADTTDQLSALEDGRHPVLLTAVGDGTIEFDAVRLEGRGIENNNPTTRSLPVKTHVPTVKPKAVYWITVEDRAITRIEPQVPT